MANSTGTIDAGGTTRVVAGIDEAGSGAPWPAHCRRRGRAAAGTAPYRPDPGNQRFQATARAGRNRLADLIRAVAVSSAVGYASADEIDELGISRAESRKLHGARPGASLIACRTSPCSMPLPASYRFPEVGLIDGDVISLSVAAASILAKTERDRYMRRIHEEDQRYHFNRHVGYGTPIHLQALRTYGPCSIHRRSFRGVLTGVGE